MPDEDYDVGYGKPPKHTRFKKGQSGNPRGRPKGAKNLMKILESELAARRTVVEGGRRISLSNGEALIKRLVIDSLSGKAAAQQKLLDLWRQLLAAAESEDVEPDSSSASEAQRAALEAFRRQIIKETAVSAEMPAKGPLRKVRRRKRPVSPRENKDVE